MSGARDAESLFSEWLARRAAGADEPIESLQRRHPELARELRRLHGSWRLLSDGDLSSTPGGESLSDRLRARFGPGIDPEISLDRDATQPASDARSGTDSSLMAHLRTRGPSSGRYHLDGELAKGGMGAILRVYDRDLRRNLAMKVMLEDREKLLGRFLEEAQVTGQLDHPGIVPVHELGIDARGKVFFTMKLVKGKDLREVFAMVRSGVDGWNLTRAVDVLKRVCEAMAFAHEKNVIHRDLKPGNVMVGRHGEVYVMDWGLAKVLGRKETKDVRVAPQSQSLVSTDRHEAGMATPDSALLTMDGDAIGTPSYMPIEQAEGNLEAIGPRSDIYAIGAMLHHLLAGRPPYVDADENPDGRTILTRVLGGPPDPIGRIAKDAPAELIAICEKAMAREAAKRYPTMADLEEDLRAYLERRVVKAHRTGMFAETRMWVVRNPVLALSFVLLVASLCGVVWLQRIAVERERNVAMKERAVATSERARAAESARVLQLADVKELRDLTERGRNLLDDRSTMYRGEAAYAGVLASLRAWIQDAETLSARLPNHEATLADLETRGQRSENAGEWKFESREDAWWHSALSELVIGIRSLSLAEASAVSIPAALARIEESEAIFAHSVGEHRNDWDACIASIADRIKSPAYAGLRIVPQIGLLPIGRDPRSGLFEFWLVDSTGVRPPRAEDGSLSLRDDFGLVFVLIPGGTFWMGAQRADPSGRNYDPQANENEGPVHEVTLAPYFLSKYEMTQHQWVVGSRRDDWFGSEKDSRFPVHSVSWNDAKAVLGDLLLDLATEAQWEYAARAGTSTPWYSGPDPSRTFDVEVLYDERSPRPMDPVVVGSLPGNPFGLHDMLGNLSEFCRDHRVSTDEYEHPVAPKTGLRRVDHPVLRALRGGSCWIGPVYARVSIRTATETFVRYLGNGVRPMRVICD